MKNHVKILTHMYCKYVLLGLVPHKENQLFLVIVVHMRFYLNLVLRREFM